MNAAPKTAVYPEIMIVTKGLVYDAGLHTWEARILRCGGRSTQKICHVRIYPLIEGGVNSHLLRRILLHKGRCQSNMLK